MRAVVVLPTYNERLNIEPFVNALRTAAGEIDLLVVDDNSPDGTADAVRALAANDGHIQVLQRPGKDGLGSAYRTGFQRVLDEGYDVVVSMDADLSHDPGVIPRMLDLLEGGADAVIGSRYVSGGATPDWPLHRRMLSQWGNGYTRSILRIPVRDCTSGYRAYRASALQAIDPASTSAEGYAFLTELARRLADAGFVIDETPIVFRNRTLGKSKMSARIIAESMLRVTWWGLSGALGRRRRRRED